jgi:hypothetical protein
MPHHETVDEGIGTAKARCGFSIPVGVAVPGEGEDVKVLARESPVLHREIEADVACHPEFGRIVEDPAMFTPMGRCWGLFRIDNGLAVLAHRRASGNVVDCGQMSVTFFVPVGAVLLKLEKHSRDAFREVGGTMAAMGAANTVLVSARLSARHRPMKYRTVEGTENGLLYGKRPQPEGGPF